MIKLFYYLIEQLYFRIPNNLAIYDQLTKVYNANWMLKIGYKKYANKECFVTMIDLNNFKQINDLAGHAMGNGILIATGRQLEALKYIDDKMDICRYGGDEFIIFSSLDISSYLIADKTDLISFGVTYKTKDIPIEAAIKLADGKMYKYKKKNKITIKSEQDIIKILRNTTIKRKKL